MNYTKIDKKNVCDIKIFALSTCGWCKKTKQYLKDLGLEFSYVDVDTLTGKERDNVETELAKWNPDLSFPTIVVNNSECIVGFQPDKLEKIANKK